MTDIKSFISGRFSQKEDKFSKMDKLAQKSSYGELSSFSGLFKTTSLSEKEQFLLRQLLDQFKTENTLTLDVDFQYLSSITSEIKAIHNQAIILHGDRIKKVQEVLKNYQEGAFTAWLIATYGNRQTPYNFLQYYLFYESLPDNLREKLTQMPKQAIYALASRTGLDAAKRKIVTDYNGETKNEILATIREYFPLREQDKRKQNITLFSMTQLSRLMVVMSKKAFKPKTDEKETILHLLDQLRQLTEKSSC